jgi:GT2 family glycosyltransferase
MDISIIIINYKSPKLVLDCIASIYQQPGGYSFEIILVDNDSKDDCKQQVLAKYGNVIWLPMDYNAGFARANNAGISIAKGEYLLILNADTIILENAINNSLRLLKNYPGAVGAGVQLLNTDGSHQISGAHFIKGGLNTLLPLPYLGRFIRYLGYRFKTTDWIVGAYMLVNTAAAKQSGLFDEDFFMYAEEIEWCARLRKLGKLVLFAQPKVIHIGGGTSGDYYKTEEAENGKNLWNRKGRQIMVSNMLRIRKQFGIGWFLFILSVYFAAIPIFAICLFIEKLVRGKASRFNWGNVNDYIANMRVLLGFFFKMIKNKPYFYKTT